MYADLPVTMRRLRLYRWLLCAALMLACGRVGAELHQARDESLHTVFTALSMPLGVPVVVSREVARKRFTGGLDLAVPQQTLEALALQQGLIWHNDGQVIHVYDANEAKSSAVALQHVSVDRFRSLMRRAGLDEPRYPLRASGARTFYVSGPPNYVDHVLRLAQLLDRQRAALRVGTQAFGVVQVLNTPVADREYRMGEHQVAVPGMASMIQTALAGERRGLLADTPITVIPYPDTNSLLVKGAPGQVGFIEQLVAELDIPKRSVEVSLWLIDLDRDALEKLALAGDKDVSTSITRVLEPLDDNRLMAQIAALERRRRASVVKLPVILTHEQVPAVFQDNHTFYLPAPEDVHADWKPVGYGTQVSVLPRFVEANQIELLLDIEDGRQLSEAPRRYQPTAVGRVAVNSVVRVPQGRRLWLGPFSRETQERRRSTARSRAAQVRLFVLQARTISEELKSAGAAVGPPPLTPTQYERVQRAFVKPGLERSP